MDSKKAQKTMKDSWIETAKVLKKYGKEDEFLMLVNKHFAAKFKNIDQITKGKIITEGFVSEENINEDFRHFWDLSKVNFWPAFSFYPALNVWMEIDKLIKGEGANFKIILAYSLFFILLITGKHVISWSQWKRDNPEEFEQEGKPGPFTFKRK